MTIQCDLNKNTVPPGVVRKQTLRNSVVIYRQGLLVYICLRGRRLKGKGKGRERELCEREF